MYKSWTENFMAVSTRCRIDNDIIRLDIYLAMSDKCGYASVAEFCGELTANSVDTHEVGITEMMEQLCDSDIPVPPAPTKTIRMMKSIN